MYESARVASANRGEGRENHYYEGEIFFIRRAPLRRNGTGRVRQTESGNVANFEAKKASPVTTLTETRRFVGVRTGFVAVG